MPIDPIVGAALIQGGGSLLSSLFRREEDTGRFTDAQIREIHRRNRQRFEFEKTLQPGQFAQSNIATQSLLGRLQGANMQRGFGRNLFLQGRDVLRNNPFDLSTRQANEMTALNTAQGRGELSSLTGRLSRSVGLESSQAQRGILGSLQGIAQRGRFAINQEQFGRERAGRDLAFRLQQAGTGFQRV